MNSYYLIRCGVLESIFLSLFHLNRQRRRFKGKNIFLITFPWLLCPSPGFFWKKSQDVILYPFTPKICSLVNGVYQVESFWYHHWCRFIAILEFLLCIGNYDWEMQCGVMLGEKRNILLVHEKHFTCQLIYVSVWIYTAWRKIFVSPINDAQKIFLTLWSWVTLDDAWRDPT